MAPGVVRTLALISGTAPSSRRSFTTICSARLRAVFLGYAFSNSSLTVCGLGFIVVSPWLRLRCQAVVDQQVFQIVHLHWLRNYESVICVDRARQVAVLIGLEGLGVPFDHRFAVNLGALHVVVARHEVRI